MTAGDDFSHVALRLDDEGAQRWDLAVRPHEGWLADDLRHALAQAQCARSAFDVIAETARRLGFEHCAYGVRIRVPFTRPRTFLISNYDVRWQERYRDAGYLHTDPTVAHGMRSAAPLIWSREVFCQNAQMWSEARSFDLCVGWAQSSFDAAGSVGMLTLARSHEALSRNEVRSCEPRFAWLAHVAHVALSGALCRANRAWQPPLSPREVEVLRWMADGKTSEEIALLLRISVHTVNFHVKNVKAKLQAANKTAAVASAIGLGLLN